MDIDKTFSNSIIPIGPKKLNMPTKKIPNKDLLGALIAEKGFRKTLDFASEVKMSSTDLSNLIRAKRTPTDEEFAKIKEKLKGLQNVDERLKKWKNAVAISLAMKISWKKNSKKKSKSVKEKNEETIAQVQKQIAKKQTMATEPRLSAVLEKLSEIPNIPDSLILHVMHYYKK